jgi:5,10-methylene-tetrahydrofolate dehydrogenase/methenyl tetrahydrofolate cyclohydrolase
MAIEVINSTPVVSAMLDNLSQRSALLAEDGVPPQLSVVSTYSTEPATRSYLRKARQESPRAGVRYAPYFTDGDLAAAEANIAMLNDVPGSATMYMAPHEPLSPDKKIAAIQQRVWRRLVGGILPHKDADSLASQKFTYPNTALSVLDLGEYMAGQRYEDIDPDRIVFYGLGNLVNAPAWRRLLARYGLTVPDPEPRNKQINRPGYPLVISRELGNLDELDNLGKRADLVLAAAGVAEQILPHHLQRPAGSRAEPLVVVDAAYKIGTDGVAHGNLHRDVYDPRQDVAARVTPWSKERGPHDGVGPLTVAYLLKHTVDAAQIDLSLRRGEPATPLPQLSLAATLGR